MTIITAENLRDQAGKLFAENISLKTDIDTLRKRNTQLSRRLLEKSMPRKHLDEAYSAAKKMITFAVSGFPTSREFMFQHGGIRRRSWNRAFKLCKMAGIVDGWKIDPDGKPKLDDLYMKLQNNPRAFRRPYF